MPKITRDEFWKHYNGNLKWLPRRTIFITEHGSHAYGTNGPDSDFDYKGIAVAPEEYYLGFVNRFEQADRGWEGIDCSVFELTKFMQLAAENNPNIIELLFVDPSNWVYPNSTMSVHDASFESQVGAWSKIHQRRDLFLSKNCKARFSGYAISQLKRILSHRRYLLNPPKCQPSREQFGLPEYTAIPKDQRDAAESQIQKQLEAWELEWHAIPDEAVRIDFKNRWVETLAEMQLHSQNIFQAAGRKLGFDEHFLEYLKQERAYRSASAEWRQYQTWLKERNPARAELERKFKMDTKHAMHLCRLLRMAREILEGKGVIVKRPDADELKAIRFEGAWTFDKLIEWAQMQDKELEELKKVSKLPNQPDRKKLDEICVDVIHDMITW